MEYSLKIALIMALSLVALFSIPIFLISIRKSKRAKLLKKKFQSFSVSLDMQLSEQDVWDDRGIGIDHKLLCILFAKGKEFNDRVEKIELQKIRRCEVNKTSRNVDSIIVIDRIDLRIIFKEPNVPHLLLGFYTVQEDGQVFDELQLAEKWEMIINASI